MKHSKRQLIGSPSRDNFKWRHKHRLHERCFAVDLDLAWVGKSLILAFFDYKIGRDRINYNEMVAYRNLHIIAPVIIAKECSDDIFDLSSFRGEQFSSFLLACGVGWDYLRDLRDLLERAERQSCGDWRLYRRISESLLTKTEVV